MRYTKNLSRGLDTFFHARTHETFSKGNRWVSFIFEGNSVRNSTRGNSQDSRFRSRASVLLFAWETRYPLLYRCIGRHAHRDWCTRHYYSETSTQVRATTRGTNASVVARRGRRREISGSRENVPRVSSRGKRPFIRIYMSRLRLADLPVVAFLSSNGSRRNFEQTVTWNTKTSREN